MCHGRRDWSRASSEERERWDVRARERLREMVGDDGDDEREEAPERPAVEAEPTAGEAEGDGDGEESERERPVVADD